MSTNEDTNAARRGSESNGLLGLVERLRNERTATRWTRGVDADYPVAWEPSRLCQEAAAEIERLRSALEVAQSEERMCCARVCDQVADDLLEAVQREGGSYDDGRSAGAAARLCAQELRDGHEA